MPTPHEVEAAIRLRAHIKGNGLQRAVDLMEPTEKAMARRIICHALEVYAAPPADVMLTGPDRIKADQMWRDHSERLRFEKETSRHASESVFESYHVAFRAWAAKQIGAANAKS